MEKYKIYSESLYVYCTLRARSLYVIKVKLSLYKINPFALELDIYSLAHHLCKM